MRDEVAANRQPAHDLDGLRDNLRAQHGRQVAKLVLCREAEPDQVLVHVGHPGRLPHGGGDDAGQLEQAQEDTDFGYRVVEVQRACGRGADVLSYEGVEHGTGVGRERRRDERHLQPPWHQLAVATPPPTHLATQSKCPLTLNPTAPSPAPTTTNNLPSCTKSSCSAIESEAQRVPNGRGLSSRNEAILPGVHERGVYRPPARPIEPES